MTSCVFTYDHRYGDATSARDMLKIVKDYVEDPENFNPDNHKDRV